ncbi:MAG: amino acid permease [Acidobacteria bacterium]|nr:MAG: amino acid permease [Acidobacteriota bacterium]
MWMVTALVVGNMIGSGIFLLPAALGSFGGISLIGWIVSAGGATLLALVFSRLSRLVKKSGGPYVYTREAFGDFPGFLVAWGYWISIWTTNAAIAVAFVSYMTLFWEALGDNAVLSVGLGLATIWVLTWVNVLGVHTAGVVQLVTTVLKVLPLLAIAFFGLFYVDVSNFQPFNASGQSPFAAVTATVALTVWAFLGLESGTTPAEHVHEPEKTIPRATIIGTLGTAVIYILGTVAVMGTIAPADLAGSNAPYAEAARVMWGSWAGYAVGAGAVVSCFGALNGWLLLQGQIPLAAARDGLFPKMFGRMSKYDTPAHGLVFSSVLASLLLMMNYSKSLIEQFTFIILLATLNTLVPYLFCSLAELMLRRKLSYASIVSLLAFAFSLWAIAGAGQEIVYWGFLLLMLGVPVYVWIHRDRSGALQ